jgi:nicotinamidase-related amidase
MAYRGISRSNVDSSFGFAMLDRRRTLLLVVDEQEAFRPAIADFDRVVAATRTMVRAAGVLAIPVIVTEQYPCGLGRTVEEIAAQLDRTAPLEKISFSATGAEGFDLGGRDQVLLCGIEAHVCVWQTASKLRDQGVEVHAVTDAIGSRAEADRAIGFGRIGGAGGILTSVETALFELLGAAGSPEFKEVQALIK